MPVVIPATTISQKDLDIIDFFCISTPRCLTKILLEIDPALNFLFCIYATYATYATLLLTANPILVTSMASPQERNNCYNKTLYAALSRINTLQHPYSLFKWQVM